jgi:hypothetical protein
MLYKLTVTNNSTSGNHMNLSTSTVEAEIDLGRRDAYFRIGSRAMHAYLEDPALRDVRSRPAGLGAARPRSLPFYEHRRSETGARVIYLGRLVVTID